MLVQLPPLTADNVDGSAAAAAAVAVVDIDVLAATGASAATCGAMTRTTMMEPSGWELAVAFARSADSPDS